MKTIAIIGRPNVGKSTLSNVFSEDKKAVTSPVAGTTRDFVEQIGEWQGRKFNVIDTGGLIAKPEDFIEQEVQDTLQKAFDMADILIEVVDARTGIHPLDREIAKRIKKTKKPSYLLVNKVDSNKWEAEAGVFSSLGFEKRFNVSAITGIGLGDFLDDLTENIDIAEEIDDDRIKFALFGKPNVGKSSLFNQIIGEKRTIESDTPGTTIDIVEHVFTFKGKTLALSDTAGIRKKSKVYEQIETASRKKVLQLLNHIDVACLVIDASEPISRQDKRIASILEEAFIPVVIVINKSDLIAPVLDPDDKNTRSIFYEKKNEIERKLSMLHFADIIFTSAKDTFQINSILKRVIDTQRKYETEIDEDELNQFFRQFIAENPPRASRKHKTGSLSKMTLVSRKPMIFGVKKSSKGFISDNYLTFLRRKIHEKYKLDGIPIRLKMIK